MTARLGLGAIAIALALVGALPARAHADVWQTASGIDAGDSATAIENYDHELAAGDAATELAHAGGLSYANTKRQLEVAIDSYRRAASVRPKLAEPYFRIGAVLYAYYIQDCSVGGAPQLSMLCDAAMLNRGAAQAIIDAWDAAEARAPLDPRFGSMTGSQFNLLFERAVLNTKLADTNTAADTKRLQAAARDYALRLARMDPADPEHETTLSNLAETYMMLGDLEHAIDTYGEAYHAGTDTSTSYGLAVALDRDDQGDRARAIISYLGPAAYNEFRERVRTKESFYVPFGEVYYYLALAEEAVRDPDQAIVYWNAFLDSGAHPQFRARAKENRDALLAKRRAKPAPPPLPPDAF